MLRSGSCTSDLYKIIKDSLPFYILRQIQIRIIVYLYDMLLIRQTINGLKIVRDTLIFLLQGLGFVINLQKFVPLPLQKMNFLGLEMGSVRMTLTLQQEKAEKIRLKWFLQQQQVVAVRNNPFYQSAMYLNQFPIQELQWWFNNLEICNGRLIVSPTSRTLIQSDASKKGWGYIVRKWQQGFNGLSRSQTFISMFWSC